MVKAVVYLIHSDGGAPQALAVALETLGIDVEAFTSAAEFLKAYDSQRPCCLVSDSQLPEMSGPALWQELRKRNCPHPFILITENGASSAAVEALRQGAFDVLEKPLDPRQLVTSITRAVDFDLSMCYSRRCTADVAQRIGALTDRQREIMELVVGGRLTKQIAKTLAISTKTVEVHRSNITKRMGVSSVAQLVKLVTDYKANRYSGELAAGRDSRGDPVAPIAARAAGRPRLLSLPESRPAIAKAPATDSKNTAAQPALIRVLLVDDEPADVEFARRALSQVEHPKFEVRSAGDLTEAFAHLSTGTFDVVLLDLGLPECTGLESLRTFREWNREIPVVVFTGLRDEQAAMGALDQGAQDYLVKANLSADMLSRSIRFAVQRQQLVAATIQHQIELEARVTLAAIVESSDDAIGSESLEGVITSWNLGAERIFGYSKEEVLGRNISFLFPPDRANEMQLILQAVRDGESLQHLDTERVHRDGRRVHISLSVSPIKDRDDRIIGMSEIARDITQSKQAKDMLAEQAGDLTRAYAGLEQVNRELKQFAYAASHDLKEPLRMVTNYCQLLDLECHDRLGVEAGKYLHFATEGAKRMQVLVDDLLSFSVVGMTDDPPAPVDLREAFDGALVNLEAAIQESGARIEAESLPTVPGNRSLLTMLFQNLIGNAIKFRRDCVPLVRVSCASHGEGWELAVEDNGIGIEPEYHERILGLFQRLHTRDEYPGTGIGLATCKKIVEFHGGRIWVTSRPGLGTTMRFTLPRNAVPATPGMNPEATGEPIEMLLVEDNAGDVELAMTALKRSRLPHHVTIARNGLEALAILRHDEPFGECPRPSLILLDLNLPKKRGLEVIAEIRKDPSLKQIRVVVFTSSQAEDDIAQAQALEADEYVAKPVELERYFAAVTSIGERHSRSIRNPKHAGPGPVRGRGEFYWGTTRPADPGARSVSTPS